MPVPTSIAMPKLGMTMRKGDVIEWRAAAGDRVEKGAIILVIESEKSVIEIEAPASGVLRHVYVEPGTTVPCGTVLAAITESADEPFDAEAFRASLAPAAPSAAPAAAPRGSASAIVAHVTSGSAGADVAQPEAPATPAARRLARELNVDLGRVVGSGPGGRITREDVQELAARLAARVEVEPGVALDVLTDGSGPDVVLLPGFGTDISAFAAVVPGLAQSCRLRAVNPRGIGFSDAPASESYDVATAARDVARVIGETPAHVVGASLGAAVAMELALTHPKSVRSLVLITPFVEANGRLLALLDAWSAAAGRTDADVLARMIVAWMFSPSLLADDARRERVVRAFASTAGRIKPDVLMRWGTGLRAWAGTRAGDLQRIAAPTLVITGDDDVLTPSGHAVAAAIPGAEHLALPETGHAAAIEQGPRVAAAIVGHVRAHA
jgi:pimeloyl-ACP methyl ester carboxylesterase